MSDEQKGRTIRVLVTGSRKWMDKAAVQEALYSVLYRVTGRLVVVHGDCPDGADRMAKDWCELNGIDQEPHPAEWVKADGKFDKSAGMARNAQMVDKGARVCLAFIKNKSRGATHCVALAEKAGILTLVWEQNYPSLPLPKSLFTG